MAYINGKEILFSPQINIGVFDEQMSDEIELQNELLTQTLSELEGKVDPELYDNGFADGRQAEYDAFWDAFQDYGNRTDYRNAFRGAYWNAQNLNPKYTFKVVEGTAMFSGCYFSQKNYNDLLDISHIELDVSQATSLSQMFRNAKVNQATLICGAGMTNLSQAFMKDEQGAIRGMDITLLVPNANCDWTNAFAYHNVRSLNLLEGTVIGTNGFNVRWATGLSKANIKSIIQALSPNTSGLTVTLSQTAVDNAYAERDADGGITLSGSATPAWAIDVAYRSNWTISLV